MTAQPEYSSHGGKQLGCTELGAMILIVFLILLLLPLFGPMPKGSQRISEVRCEIASLEDAIVRFKVTFGVEPPSGIVLHADQAEWDADQRGKMLIRQIWPRFDFANCGGLHDVPPSGVTLTGAECLVFFLSGITNPANGYFMGFSTDSRHPFSTDVTNRVGPFFEFKGAFNREHKSWTCRLVDDDHDGFPEYRDPLPQQTKPYLYVSSYDGKGYCVEDLGGAMRDVYRGRDGVPFKPNGFQIISPGTDGKYGQGGIYDYADADAELTSDRAVECDNITNFVAESLVYFSDPQTRSLIKLGSINLILFVLATLVFRIRGKNLLLLLIVQLIASGLLLPMTMTSR